MLNNMIPDGGWSGRGGGWTKVGSSQLDFISKVSKVRTAPKTRILFAKVILAWTDSGFGNVALFITIYLSSCCFNSLLIVGPNITFDTYG